MDRTTVFTKTAKGLMEATGKTSILSRDMRALLKEVDGKATVAEVQAKLSKVPEAKLQAALQALANNDFIREFKQSKTAAPSQSSAAPQSPAEVDIDLDFTTAIPTLPSLAKKAEDDAGQKVRAVAESAARAKAVAEANTDAAAAASASRARAEAEARAQAEAAARVKASAVPRGQRDAEAQARKDPGKSESDALELFFEQRERQEAEERGANEAEAQERREAEEAERKAREAAERARQEAEERARREAEEQARREAEELARAQEAARIEAEARAREEAEEAERRSREEAEEAERKAREAAERERQEAEERARREAEEQARREAEELARAQEAARIEAEARARKEAEEAERRAREDAERKAKEAAERKAREDAERKAQAAAERERQEAEKRARREAEKQARREAEELARAQEQARKDAEARARKEAEERDRREAEESERREREDTEREAKEAAERERKEAEEKVAPESAPQPPVPVEPGSSLDDLVRIETDFDAVLLASAGAAAPKRSADADDELQSAAEEQARRLAEEQASREAEARARVEADAAAERSEDEHRRKDKEERALYEADEPAQVRYHAEAQALVQAQEAETERHFAEMEKELEAEGLAAGSGEKPSESRERARKREQEEARERERTAAAARADEAETALAAEAAVEEMPVRDRTPVNWGRPTALALFLILVLGIISVPFIPFDGYIPQFEKLAGAYLQQPVKIKTLHLMLLPQPHWRLDDVFVGNQGQLTVARVNAIAELGSLFSDKKVFKSIELESPVISEEGLLALLYGKPLGRNFKVARIIAKNGKLDSKTFKLPALDATIAMGENDGTWQTIALETPDHNTKLQFTPDGAGAHVEVQTNAFSMPLNPAFVLKNFDAKGVMFPGELRLSEFNGEIYGGYLSGTADLKWGADWSLSGEIKARAMDPARFASKLIEGGSAEGKATYALQGKSYA